MTFYEIEQKLTELVDPETGDLLDYAAFEELQLERDTKIEHMGIWVKELTAEAKAIREEEKNLAERRRVAENKAERLKEYLGTILAGETFKTAKVALSFRKSEQVEIDEQTFYRYANEHDEFLSYAEPKPNKTAIKEAIKSGQIVEGCELVTKSNLQIK